MSRLKQQILKATALVLVAISGSAQSPSAQPAQVSQQNAQQQNAQSAAKPTASGQNTSAPNQAKAQSSAQNTQAPASDVTIKSRAQVVLLDVVATDHYGRPITDLKKEDFSVTEKGVPQQIASFSMVDVAKRKSLAQGLQPRKLPPGVYSNHRDAVAAQDQLIVLLLDALNTQWADQQYMRFQMLKYLARNHQAGQRMAIYGLSRKLIRLQDFTDDPEKLIAVIKKQKGEISPVLESNDTNAMDDNIDSAPGVAQAVQEFREQTFSAQTDMRVQMTMDALKAIGRMLQAYPGRKKLLWVSGSFPINLAPGEFSGFASQSGYGDAIFQTTALLREGQVAVYPIDPSGLETMEAFNASNPSRARSRAMGPAFSAQVSAQLQAIAARHLAVKKMAEDTGGIAFYNRNDLDTAVMKSVADGAIYYALSYSPSDKKWDGKFRRIEVKVNRPGVELRYRKGYNAVDPDSVQSEGKAQLSADIGSALNTVLASSAVTFYGSANPLKAPAPSGSTPNADAIKLADIRFLVDPESIMFHPEGDKKHCSLEFVAADFIGDKQVKAATNELVCNADAGTFDNMGKNGLLFRMPLEVVDGSTRIRLLVRDNLTGKMGTLDVPYPPRAANTAQSPAAAAPSKP